MKDATLRYVFDRKNETGHKKKEKGKKSKDLGLLQIEVRKEGTDKRVYITTGIRINPDQFSTKNGFTCKNHDNAKAITGKATIRYREIESFVLSDRCKNIDQVKYWNKEDFTDIKVEDFVNEEMSRKDLSLSRIMQIRSFLNRLNEYGRIKYFSDITYDTIVGFDTHLRKTMNSEEAIKKRHTLLKMHVQEAINRGIFKGNNPYNLFRHPKAKPTDPIYLNEKELEQLKLITPDYGYLERTKDLFLFQCYTGMSYADLMKFDKDSISVLDGYKTIKSNRQKTDENFILLFLPEAEKIAEKYKYVLPRLTNQKYNEYLKEIATLAGINKPLVSHSARHTFATYLLNKDIPIETVARALGHANIKQTQHYARLLGKKVIDDMKKLL